MAEKAGSRAADSAAGCDPGMDFPAAKAIKKKEPRSWGTGRLMKRAALKFECSPWNQCPLEQQVPRGNNDQ
jgi:hypothetical protein